MKLILDTKLIDQLLSKKTFLGKGATSTCYKVYNCFTEKGHACLKVLNSEFFTPLNDQSMTESKNPNIWNDDDDSTEQEEEQEKVIIDMKKVQLLYNEFELLSQLNHPNIVKFYGFYYGDEKHSPAMLIEYCKFNLEKVIHQLEDIDLVAIIYQICVAMKYIHKKKIIHCDLKMRNILINTQKEVKICDFGISKCIDLTTLTSITHDVGTLAFMAPEMFNENIKYNEKVDVYAFGVVMYFILTKGSIPKFTGIGCYLSLPLPNCINKLSQRIIKKCWSKSPEDRPSFRYLLDLIVKKNFLLIDGIENEIFKLKEQLEIFD